MSTAQLTRYNNITITNPEKAEIDLYNTDNIDTIDDIYSDKKIQRQIKRIIDVTCTVAGLMVIFPLLLLIAVLIKLDSPGPVLFKQKRVGQNGKEFYIYKFRTMHQDAEARLQELLKYNETNELMFKMTKDPRITSIGKFLRKYSLDEFPQLINVLKGEMSLVGFRPPIPREVAQYKRWHHLRFKGMPGLTGPWQVSGRSSIKNFDTVVELEIDYNFNWSLLKDFAILFKTVPVVIFGKDAA